MNGFTKCSERRSAGRRHVIRGPAVCWMLIVAAAWSAGRVTAADNTLWELRPYQVQILMVADSAPVWSPQRLAEVRGHVAAAARNQFGATWQLAVDVVADASANVRAQQLARGDAEGDPADIAADSLPADLDKLILVSLHRRERGFAVSAREWDALVRVWGPPIDRRFAQPSQAGRAALQAVASAFAPQALVVSAANDQLAIRPRASQLGAGRQPAFYVGAVARLVERRANESGTPVDGTLLVVESAETTKTTARLHSRYQQPLASGEYVALQISAPSAATEIKFVSAEADAPPQAGLDVVAVGPSGEVLERLGSTGTDGVVTIPPASTRLRTIVAFSGGQPLVRIPLVPGMAEQIEIAIPIDRRTVAALAAVAAARGRLLDLVVQRDVGLRRAQSLADAGKQAEAQQLLDDLRASLQADATRLNQSIDEQRRSFRAGDDAQNRRLEQLWDKVAMAIGTQLDPTRIELSPAGGGE